MIGASEATRTLRAITELVNTGTPYGKCVATRGQMGGFLFDQGLVDDPALAVTIADLVALLELRGRLRVAWQGDPVAALVLVNALLEEGHVLPVLVAEGGGYRITTRPRPPVAVRVGAQAAVALAAFMVAGEFDRLSGCQRPGCPGFITDLSSNRSRRFCADACATRVHVQEHRARKRGSVVAERVER